MIIKAGNTSDMSRIQLIIYVLSLEIETEDFFLSPAVLLRSFPFHRGRGGTENQALSLPTFPVTDQLITDGPTHHVLSAVLFDHAIHPYRVPEVTIPAHRMQEHWG